MAQDQGTGVIITSSDAFTLPPKRTSLQHIAEFFKRKPLGAFGAIVALILILVAIFANVLATHDPYEIRVAPVFTSPTSETLLGTDHLGRDVYSRIVHGARISLYVGILSSFIGCAIGLVVLSLIHI